MRNARTVNQPGFVPGERTACRRCGVCCLKGGPCLHLEDIEIIEKGEISVSDLFTIRQGEPAWDNIKAQVVSSNADIIKIKSGTRTTACMYYDPKNHSCAVYSSRPVECRVLNCRDISEIVAIYDKRRLSRKVLLEKRAGLWTLVSAHQETCDYGKISQLVRDNDISGLSYLVRYDRAYRELMVEKGAVATALLDFLLGFPLAVTIRRYGLSLGDIGIGCE